MRRSLSSVLLFGALFWHAMVVLYPAWLSVVRDTSGRDFASYYYAARVAQSDGDPWAKRALSTAARSEETRKGVHPFLYPPPFLAVVWWSTAYPLDRAAEIWFWLDEVAAVVALLAFARAWRGVHPLAAAVLAVLAALWSAVPNNHAMGQANFLPLALVGLGLWAESEERDGWAGGLIGLACMWKMSPALFVFVWLAQRRWRAVGGAVAVAVAASVASLPLVDASLQLHFFRDVLPTFSSGGYNGLSVPIQLFGNHSLPNWFDQLAPGDRAGLSSTGRMLSSGFALGGLAGLCVAFRHPTRDPMTRAGRAGAVGVLLLLVPVYTYEHHLVWAIPAAAAAVLAVGVGRLGAGWAPLVGASVALLTVDLDLLHDLADRAAAPWVAALFQEAKTLALLGLGVAGARVGWAPSAPVATGTAALG